MHADSNRPGSRRGWLGKAGIALGLAVSAVSAEEFKLCRGAVLQLPIPESWRATAELKPDEDPSVIKLESPEGETFDVTLFPLWKCSGPEEKMTPDQVALLGAARSSPTTVHAAPGTSELRFMGDRAEVSLSSFQERESAAAEVRYGFYANTITRQNRRVFIDVSLRHRPAGDPVVALLVKMLEAAKVVRGAGDEENEAVLSTEEEAKVERLLARVRQYDDLVRRGRFRQAIAMWAKAYRKDERGGDSIREMKQWQRVVPEITGMQIEEVWLRDSRANVTLILEGKAPDESGADAEISEAMDTYWLYEDGDWRYIPLKPADWTTEKATKVPMRLIRRDHPTRRAVELQPGTRGVENSRPP